MMENRLSHLSGNKSFAECTKATGFDFDQLRKSGYVRKEAFVLLCVIWTFTFSTFFSCAKNSKWSLPGLNYVLSGLVEHRKKNSESFVKLVYVIIESRQWINLFAALRYC